MKLMTSLSRCTERGTKQMKKIPNEINQLVCHPVYHQISMASRYEMKIIVSLETNPH